MPTAVDRPVLRQALERVKTLLDAVPYPGEAAASPIAANRVRKLLRDLVEDDEVRGAAILTRLFLTTLSDGTFQVEWKEGVRYVEIEVPDTGPLDFFTADSSSEEAGAFRTPAAAAARLLAMG